MMYCQPESVMLVESQLLKAIGSGVEINLSNGKLKLVDKEAKINFFFEAIK